MKTTMSILLLFSVLFAQKMMRMGPPPDVMERIETLKMWKLTEALELTEEQAAVLFPAMRQFQRQQDSIRQRQTELLQELQDALNSKADSAEILGIIDEMTSLKYNDCENEADFIRKARSVLTAEQQAKYIIFEQEFRKQMMEMIRDFRRGKCRREMMENPWEQP